MATKAYFVIILDIKNSNMSIPKNLYLNCDYEYNIKHHFINR